MKNFYQCAHRDAKPGQCFVEGCYNFGGIKETDIEAIFGKRSSPYLSNRLMQSSPELYKTMKLQAEARGLIVPTRVPRCLQPDPE